LGVASQIRAHDLGTEPGEKQDQTEVPESVGDGVSERGVRDQDRLFRGVNRQLDDRTQTRAERSGLRHPTGQDAHRDPFIEFVC
jgi:hypothetical protein